MKKQTLAGLALSTALFSSLNASSCQINSGAYVGLSLGGAHLGGKNDFQLSNQNLGAPEPSSSHKLSSNSFNGIVFVGYGLKFGTLWCAAEILYQFDNLSSKDRVSADAPNDKGKVVESKTTGAFGGAVHIGALMNPNTVIYAILGVEGRSFRVKFNDDQQATTCTINKRYTSTAFTPGVGFRFSVSKNLALKTEYKYSLHQSKKLTSDTKPSAAGGNDIVTLKHAPNIQSFNVGLVYTF